MRTLLAAALSCSALLAPDLRAGEACIPGWTPTFGEGRIVNGAINAYAVFDDGSGPSLYVGGTFTFIGGLDVRGLARWDGTRWRPVPGNVSGAGRDVHALAVFDDGSGPALYVGGEFTGVQGVLANHVARWDGTGWSALGSGLNDRVTALAVHDDGSGPALYAGGLPAERVARWDGAGWSALDDGVLHGIVQALLVHDDGTGAGLCVGGSFRNQPAARDTFLARWKGCPPGPPFTPYCFGDGTTTACPCGNVGLPGHGCDLAQGTGGIELAVTSFAPDGLGGGTADFVATGYPPASAPGVTLIRNTSAQAPPTVFGDGLLCIGASGAVRVSATLASGGTSLNPVMHGAGAGTFYYQVWARNTPIVFCDPTAAFNLSNGVELTWP